VTVAREIRRLQRSLDGVESSYVFELGHRERSETLDRPLTAGHQARRAADRLDGAYRRVRGERPSDSSRRLARR
jgi:hypothetical protein